MLHPDPFERRVTLDRREDVFPVGRVGNLRVDPREDLRGADLDVESVRDGPSGRGPVVAPLDEGRDDPVDEIGVDEGTVGCDADDHVGTRFDRGSLVAVDEVMLAATDTGDAEACRVRGERII